MIEAQPKRQLKPIFKILIPVIILLIFVFIIIFLTGPVNRFNKTVVDVEIVQGTSTSKIGDILKEKKLIRSKTLFKIYSKIGNTKSLQAGVYQFSQNMSLKEIVDELGNGSSYNPNEISITFREGINIREVCKEIEKVLGIPYEEGQRPRPRTHEDDEFDTKLFKELDLVLAKDETKLHFYADDTGIPYEKNKNPFPRTARDDEIEAAFIKEFGLALAEDKDEDED